MAYKIIFTLMKKYRVILYILIAIIASAYSGGPFGGGAGNRTGAQSSTPNCTGNGCHHNKPFTTLSATIILKDKDNNELSKYIPRARHIIELTANTSDTLLTHFGFQFCVVADDATQQSAGVLDTITLH